MVVIKKRLETKSMGRACTNGTLRIANAMGSVVGRSSFGATNQSAGFGSSVGRVAWNEAPE